MQSSPADQTSDDDARKYEEAYNKGDAKTLAKLYSDDVDYMDQDRCYARKKSFYR